MTYVEGRVFVLSLQILVKTALRFLFDSQSFADYKQLPSHSRLQRDSP